MKKLGLVAIIAVVVGGAGTLAYFQFAGGTTPEGYIDTNVCVFHAMMGKDSTRRWAAIPGDRGQV